MEINGIKGKLRDYQKEGVEFFIKANGRALLCDEMGTGKTLQSLAYIVSQGFKRTLVITPASVKFVWEAEAAKFTNLKTFVIDSKTDITLISHEVEIVVINYDILKKFYNELMKYHWDALICDEAHYCKAQGSLRSKIVRFLSRDIPHVLLLTGSPVLSRPIEIFNLLNMVDQKVWNNWYSFATRYADGHQGYFGFEARGATNLEELNEKISKYFLRRKKEDVLKELPTKNRIEIPIELEKEDREAYDLVESNLINYLRQYRDKTDKEIAKSLQGEKLVKLNLLREVNSMGKIKVVKELIKDIVNSEGKVIVFSCFNAPLIELSEEFEEESVLLLGSTPVDEREEIIRKFQENPNTKIFFGGIKSAGIGVTLTKATSVIFMDYSWTPSDHSQAEDRMHRFGNTAESVNIYNIVSKDSIDGFMSELLKYKQDIIDKVIEGKEVERDDTRIDSYIRSLEEKYAK
jgi:SWI/SNF-related matrix-associated actin-dependent regulator 1 of chromatin subfamily A